MVGICHGGNMPVGQPPHPVLHQLRPRLAGLVQEQEAEEVHLDLRSPRLLPPACGLQGHLALLEAVRKGKEGEEALREERDRE